MFETDYISYWAHDNNTLKGDGPMSIVSKAMNDQLFDLNDIILPLDDESYLIRVCKFSIVDIGGGVSVNTQTQHNGIL